MAICGEILELPLMMIHNLCAPADGLPARGTCILHICPAAMETGIIFVIAYICSSHVSQHRRTFVAFVSTSGN